MDNLDSATGLLITCGFIIFLAGCVIVRVLHALDDNDRDN